MKRKRSNSTGRAERLRQKLGKTFKGHEGNINRELKRCLNIRYRYSRKYPVYTIVALGRAFIIVEQNSVPLESKLCNLAISIIYNGMVTYRVDLMKQRFLPLRYVNKKAIH